MLAVIFRYRNHLPFFGAEWYERLISCTYLACTIPLAFIFFATLQV